MKLTVPLFRAKDAERLIEAGADEFYCGVMTPGWAANARTRHTANLGGFDELEEALRVARRHNVPVFLCVNARYGLEDGEAVKEHIRRAAAAGVAGFIVSEPSLVPFVRSLGKEFKVILSCLAPCINLQTLRFYADLGVNRVTLERQLTFGELGSLCGEAAKLGLELEAFAQYGCGMMDAHCGESVLAGFWPARDFGLAAFLDRRARFLLTPGVVKFLSFINAGRLPNYSCSRMCKRGWKISVHKSSGGQAVLERTFDNSGDPELGGRCVCAVCAAFWFSRLGIFGLKIMGRNNPGREVLRRVKLQRAYLDKLEAGLVNEANCVEVGRGITGCRGDECYHYEVYQKARGKI